MAELKYDVEKADQIKADMALADKLGDSELKAVLQQDLDKLNSEFKQAGKSYLSQMLGNIVTPSQMAGRTSEMQAVNEQQLANSQILSAEQDAKERAAIEAQQGGKAALSMAEQVGAGEAFRRGLTTGSREVLGGLGVIDQQQSTPMQKTYTQALEQTSPIAYGAGKILAETAPFLPASIATGGIASLPARAAATGLLGGTQANVISRGAGDSGAEQVGNTAMGTALGVASELVPFGIGRAFGYIAEKLGAPVNKVMTPQGEFTQEALDYFRKNNIDPEQALRDAQSDPNIAAQIMAESAPQTPQQAVAKTAEDYRDTASLVDANKEQLAAWETIGVDPTQLSLGTYSNNKTIASLSAAAAAMQGSTERGLLLNSSEILNNVTKRTIEEAGGHMNAATFSENTLNNMRSTRDSMFDAEQAAWEPVNETIKKFTLKNMRFGITDRPLVAELKERKQLVRGKKTSDVEEDVLNLLTSRPTYFEVDQLRKEIGESIGGIPKGKYLNQAQGKLNEMYGKLSEIQHKAASGILRRELGEESSNNLRLVNDMTINRKKLEDQIEFFGKNGFSSMISKLDNVKNGLRAGDYKQFDEVFANIPEEYKQGAAATLLNRILDVKEGSLAQLGLASNAGRFSSTWKKIESAPMLSERLSKALGEENFKVVSNLAKMYEGISRAASVPQNGGAKNALDAALKGNGIFAKLLGIGARKVTGSATGELINIASSVVEAGKSGNIENIARMTSSPTFKTALDAAMNDPAGANAIAKSTAFMKTKIARDIMKQADQDTRKQIIAAGGIPAWLMLTDKPQQQTEAQQ